MRGQFACRVAAAILLQVVAGCGTLRQAERGVTEAPPSPQLLIGDFYMGDGLGMNIYLRFSPDSSYCAEWRGCLGKYGGAFGRWTLRDTLVQLMPIGETGMMRDYFRALLVQRYRANWILVPADTRGREDVEKDGVSKYSCFQRDTLKFDCLTALCADINGDGIIDYAFGTMRGDSLYEVTVVLGPLSNSSRRSTVELSVRKVDGELCGVEGRLEIESLFATTDQMQAELDYVPQGYILSTESKGLIAYAVDGECDRVHCYWNHKKDQLDWWRL